MPLVHSRQGHRIQGQPMVVYVCDDLNNPKSTMWDILFIFNFNMDIKGLFCGEFKYLQYLLTNYLQTYSITPQIAFMAPFF